MQRAARRLRHIPSFQDADRARQPGRDGELAAGVEVVARPEVVEEREILVDGLDPEVAGVGRRVDGNRAAVHLDDSAVERERAAHALDQRRLTGAVVAEERKHLPGRDLDVEAVQPDDCAEALRRAAHCEHRRHPCLIARARRTRRST